MRPRYRPPNNKRFFHSRPKKDNRDMSVLKRRINSIKKKDVIMTIDERKKKWF